MASKWNPDCNNCNAKACNPGRQPTQCADYQAPKSGFPFPEMISRITFFKHPNKVQRALREFASARVER